MKTKIKRNTELEQHCEKHKFMRVMNAQICYIL